MHDFDNLPTFPKFRPFDFGQDSYWYPDFFSKHEYYADWSISNIFLWYNLFQDLELSKLHDCLIIRYTSSLRSKKSYYGLLGSDIQAHTYDQIFQFMKKNGEAQILYDITARSLPNNDNENFKIVEDIDNSEYVYSVSEQSKLTGKMFSRMRRNCSRFLREHSEQKISYTITKTLDESSVKVYVSAAASWGFSAQNHRGRKNYEPRVLPVSLSRLAELNFELMTLYYGEKMIGYAVYQVDSKRSVASVNHIKVDYNHNLTFDYMVHLISRELDKQTITKINLEQDLGITGIREHKRRLRPIQMMRKFNVSPR